MLEKYNVGEKINIEDFIFESKEIRVNDEIYNRIYNKSYRENNDIKLSDLVYVKLLHYDYNGEIVVGELIVNKLIADDIENIFNELFKIKYEINSMHLIDDFWIYDDNSKTDRNSILHNNSSAFFYRNIIGDDKNILSNHALGLAIDINPLDNPYTPRKEDGTFDTSMLTEYEQSMLENRIEKSKNNSHIIVLNDNLCKVFKKYDFECGGSWPKKSNKLSCDWQHFEPIDSKKGILIEKMK